MNSKQVPAEKPVLCDTGETAPARNTGAPKAGPSGVQQPSKETLGNKQPKQTGLDIQVTVNSSEDEYQESEGSGDESLGMSSLAHLIRDRVKMRAHEGCNLSHLTLRLKCSSQANLLIRVCRWRNSTNSGMTHSSSNW